MMDRRQYADLVQRTREAQREYFRTKSQTALRIACKLERQLDSETVLQSQQRTFFEQE